MIVYLSSLLLFKKTLNIFKFLNFKIFIKEIRIIFFNNKYTVALASNQIGINIFCFLFNINKKLCFIFINCNLFWTSKEFCLNTEGCVSIPNYFIIKKRYKYIVVLVLTKYNNYVKFYLLNFFSFCIQHEYDHLTGLLI